jgi:hypothetical protein
LLSLLSREKFVFTKPSGKEYLMDMGRKTFSTRLDEEKIKALKHIAVELDKNINDLLEEGIDHIIEKYPTFHGARFNLLPQEKKPKKRKAGPDQE